ncbi:MAG TPA: hypothetical protein VM555_00750 [Tahibacter sp.]|nr:hypothetical protein [Tahibacter sp.]
MATVTYSGSTVGTPTYNRTLEDCSDLSGVGTDVNYSVQPFTVDTAGAYDFTSVQDDGYDGIVFVYTGAFDASDAVTNCTAGNDDGAGGIGTSDITGVALATGTNYFFVTASYGNGDTGTFTNTITGPGNIAMPRIALEKTTPGVAVNGNFDYVLNLSNPGSTNETITVTDTLPAGLTYVSNTCGGTFAAGTFTWNAGLINSAGSATCTLTVNNPSATCPALTNTATATSLTGLTASSTTTNATNSVPDPSIEASGAAGGGDWTSTSTNFTNVFCAQGVCTSNPTLAADDGAWWAWFAGVDPANPGDATFPEIGTLEQSLTIPVGVTELTFRSRLPNCSGAAADFLSVRIDGTELLRITGTDALCDATDYDTRTVNIAAYANGASHTLSFYSEQQGTGTTMSFFVDSVAINTTACSALPDSIFANGFDPATP